MEIKHGLNFHVYVDSSYTSHAESRISQYGPLENSSLSWVTLSKVKFLALSYTEAEYVALLKHLKLLLRQFLAEFGFCPFSHTVLFEGDKSAINIIHNSNDHDRMKYMDIRYHDVRESV